MSANLFTRFLRLFVKPESRAKLRVRTELSGIQLSPPDSIKLRLTICCLLSIVLTQTVEARLEIRTEKPPRLSVQIIDEASGDEEVVYNFITADKKYIITADGKIFYVNNNG